MIKQKLLIPFSHDDALYEVFLHNLGILHGRDIKPDPESGKIIIDDIEIIRKENSIGLIWTSDVVGDTIADTIIALIGETSRTKLKVCNILRSENKDKVIVKIMEMHFGSENVHLDDSIIKITTSNNEKAEIDMKTMNVTCDHEFTRNMIERKIFNYVNSIEHYCKCRH